jgi:DNA repair and recombination protein RAD52
MFNPEQIAQLQAPLSAANVKTRDQAGRKMSYLEGWKVIEEANRIFGFDGWARETVDTKCVSEKEREIGTNKVPGWGVSYIAKTRITVTNGNDLITREGIGAGHGIDRDLGQAHESAIKEAETDAMKRALMTFGYQFGLALYDKTQEHVTTTTKTESMAQTMITAMREIKSVVALKAWSAAQKPLYDKLEPMDQQWVNGEYKLMTKVLEQSENLSA